MATQDRVQAVQQGMVTQDRDQGAGMGTVSTPGVHGALAREQAANQPSGVEKGPFF